MKASILNRKLHRWGAILTSPVLLVVIATGLLLQLKKQSDWIQPPTARGQGGPPVVSLEDILQAATGVEHAGIRTWEDVDRLDLRPDKGVVKVRGRNRWEVQVDTATGEVLQVQVRRSDLIESLHDGSWFAGDLTKLYLFLPAGVVLLGLWGTGLYLWLLPHLARRKRRRKGS